MQQTNSQPEVNQSDLVHKRHNDVPSALCHIEPLVLVGEPPGVNERVADLVVQHRAVLPREPRTTALKVHADAVERNIEAER